MSGASLAIKLKLSTTSKLSICPPSIRKSDDSEGFLLTSKRPILSQTWRDRHLGAGAGATLTLVALWLVLVSAAAAAVILRA